MNIHVSLVETVDNSYDIKIGSGLFDDLIRDLQNGLVPNVSRFAIITDSNTKKLYGDALLENMRKNGFNSDLLCIEAGEVSKTRETKSKLEDELLAKGYGRDSCVIALGGGVVTDISGFIAGTFGRGVPYINYATTFVAATDASVGGKCAVNTPVATNLIGIFYQPKKVYIDIDTWKTLPLREMQCGLAETIKHAIIADAEFFKFLEDNLDIILRDYRTGANYQIFEHIAKRNCEIKHSVVSRDERESGLRQILNLGHTAGRALEALNNYNYLHGEAVSVGIVIQAIIANDLGFLTKEDMARVVLILKRAGLPTQIPDNISTQDLVNKLYTDKKVRKNKIYFVLQDGIGKIKMFDGRYSKELSEKYLYDIISKSRAGDMK